MFCFLIHAYLMMAIYTRLANSCIIVVPYQIVWEIRHVNPQVVGINCIVMFETCGIKHLKGMLGDGS